MDEIIERLREKDENEKKGEGDERSTTKKRTN